MSTRPALTVVIPTLNRGALVGRAVESALAQRNANIEILVSDNGSTDDTPQMLSRYSDPRLRKIRHARTLSAVAHGNFLIREARGELFVGLSDDDWLEPTFCARAIGLYARHPEIRFAYSGAYFHFGDVAMPSQFGPEIESGTDFLRACFAQKREVCWCAAISRTADLRADPLPEGRIFGDMYYWTRLALRGRVGCVRAHLSHYTAYARRHINVVTVSPVPEWAREVRLLADEVASALRARIGAAEMRVFARDAARYVARSTANQFMWNSLRGASRLALVRAAWTALPQLLRFDDIVIWLRVIGGICAPNWLIEQRMIAAARRAASQRRAISEESLPAVAEP
ncbi:MAG: glycosyltransferase family 2 protein [Burkholderiales bacterium]|nr:glycosyltransferase family 2 protein [Burkholderiales bacterium]